MKCAYKRVLAEMKRKDDEQKLANQERKAREHLFAIALKTAEEKFGFSVDQLRKMLDGMFEEASDAFQTYKDETQEDYDPTTVPFLLRGFINQLDALEVDTKAIESEYQFPNPGTNWNSRRTEKYHGRLAVLHDREVTFRAYMYAFMLYLYHEYEYEGETLVGYYRAVLTRYSDTWSKYLDCNDISDANLSVIVNVDIYDIQSKVADLDGITDIDKSKNENTEKGENANG